MTRVLHTARISNVKSILCDDRKRKVVNFKLGKYIHCKKDESKIKVLLNGMHNVRADSDTNLNSPALYVDRLIGLLLDRT